jgi:hypothetical protein
MVESYEEWEIPAYRRYTEALLRRYFRMALSMGSLPSALDRPGFQPASTFHRIGSFEDAVIFVRDMERCLEKMKERNLRLVAAIVMMDCTQAEAGRLLALSERHIARLYPEALDQMTRAFLAEGLMKPLRLPVSELPRKPVASALLLLPAEGQRAWM